MKITIHRPNQIGGCITEIESTNGSRIIIDVGSNLPGNNENLQVNVEEITKGSDGVFVTHYHGDHIGEFERVDKDVPIYMGRIAQMIFMNLCKYLPDKNTGTVKNFKTFNARDRIQAGDMTVTPYRVDHSAYDSYMFLIECDGKKILHTGDFRTHGWTGGKLSEMLQNYVRKIDVLICEGTMLSRQYDRYYSERDLYNDAKKLLHDKKKIFVLCSSMNIDTIASFYLAAKEKNALVVADGYQRSNLDIVTASAVTDLYRFPYVKVYYPGRKDCIDDMRNRKKFCMFVRYSGEKFKDIMNEFPDSAFVYSLWEGYLHGRTLNREIYDFVPKNAQGEPEYIPMHTSGHAYEEAIIDVCNVTRPDIIIPIHGERPGRFEELRASGKIERGKIIRFNGVVDTKVI